MKRSTESSVNGKKNTKRTSFSRKKTNIIPSGTVSKVAPEEPVAMEKKPVPEVESVLQYAIPLKSPDSRIQADEMRQIHSKIIEHVKNLEDMYDQSNGEMTKESSPMEKPLYSFLSTCQSAASELDITTHAEYQILESLQLWYGKEVELLEKVVETEMTTSDSTPASPDTIAELIEQVKQNFHKLYAMKKHLPDLPKTLSKDPPPEPVSPIKTEKKSKVAQLPVTSRTKNVANFIGAQDVVTKLHNLVNSKEAYSDEAFEKTIQKVGKTINSHEIECQKLENEKKETEKKYSKMKAEYQLLLEEKMIIENELRQILQSKLTQKHPNIVPVKAEYKPDGTMLRSPAVTADGPQQVLPAQLPEIFLKQADNTEMEELQESGHPHSETRPPQSTTEEETAQDNGMRVNMITPEVKSAQEQSLSDTSAVTVEDNMTSHINQLLVIAGIKPTDSPHAENISQEEAKNFTDGSMLRSDVGEYHPGEQVKSISDIEHENGHTDYEDQPERVTRTSDSNDQQAGTSTAINKSLDVQINRRESISNKQEQTPLTEETSKEEEGQGTLGKTQVLIASPTKQEHVMGISMAAKFVTKEDERLASAGYDFPQTPVQKQDAVPCDVSRYHTNTTYTVLESRQMILSDMSNVIQDITPSAGPAAEHYLPSMGLSDTPTDTLRCPKKTSQEHTPSGISEIHSQLQFSGSKEIRSQQPSSKDSESHRVYLAEPWGSQISTAPMIMQTVPAEITTANLQHLILMDDESQYFLHKKPGRIQFMNRQLSSSPVEENSIFQPQKCITGKGTEIKYSVEYPQETETQKKAAEGVRMRGQHKLPLLTGRNLWIHFNKAKCEATQFKMDLTKQQFYPLGGASASSKDFKTRTQQAQSDQQSFHEKNFLQGYEEMYIKGEKITLMPASLRGITRNDRAPVRKFPLSPRHHISSPPRAAVERPDQGRSRQHHALKKGVLKRTAKQTDKRPIRRQLFSFWPLEEIAWKFSTTPSFLINGVERNILGSPYIQRIKPINLNLQARRIKIMKKAA